MKMLVPNIIDINNISNSTGASELTGTVTFPIDTLEHLVNFAVVNMAHVILFNLWQNHQCNCDIKNEEWLP